MRRKDTAKRSMFTSIMKNGRKRKTVIGTISVVLVLTVIAVLILPAIAMEDKTFCGIEEHTHDESCYETVLTCGLEEGKDHQHDDRCYESVLVCDKEEHHHSIACCSDPEADLETAEDWERSMEHIDVSDADGAVLAAVAQSQLGYKESENNYTVINDFETCGYTRYGEWYEDPYGKWSGMFAAFCVHYAGIPDYPIDDDCNDWADKLRQAELFYETHEVEPQVGDLVFLNTEAGDRVDRIGIITETEDGDDGVVSFKSVEGVPSESVQKIERSKDDTAVVGFGLMPEHKEALEQDGKESILLSANTDTDVLVTVKTDASAFEDDQESLKLTATESVGKDIDDNLKGYIDLIREKSETKEMQNPVFRVINVNLTSNDKTVDPLKVVQTAFGGLGESRQITVYSLADDRAEKLDLSEAEENTVVFDTDKLGTFIVITDAYSQSKGSSSVQENTEDTTSLEVNINWEDGKYAHQKDTVTLKLLKDGEETGDTAEVTAEDKWTYTFTGLEKPEKDSAFAYTVKEEISDKRNLDITVSEPKKVEASEGDTYWIPAKNNELKDKGTYALVSNGYMLSNDGGELSAVKAAIGGAEVVENKQYTSSLTEVSKSAQWKVNEADGELFANNKGYYMTSNGKCDVSENNSASISVDDNKLVLNNKSSANKVSISEDGNVSVNKADAATDFEVYSKVYIAPVSAHYVQEIVATGANADVSPAGTDLLLRKYIDYLGDGGNNPDTSVTGDDLYRVYLEAEGYTEPADVLVVIDASSSMTTADMEMNGVMERRLTVEDAIINGTITEGDATSAASRAAAERAMDGITSTFLAIHPENMIGMTAYAGGIGNEGESYEYWKDTFNPIQLQWTTNSGIPNGGASGKDYYVPVINVPLQYGTNYISGLMRAQEMLDDPIVANNGHKKIMIFLTDGYPNLRVDVDGNIVSGGVYSNTINYFEQFHQNNPDVTMAIVGISAEANEGSTYDLLTEIAGRTGSTYYQANDAESLKHSLLDALEFCSNVEMTDEFSTYVDYYKEKPDIVVTMKSKKTGEETVLWQNGGETADNTLASGGKILESVAYIDGGDEDHGSVKLLLDPTFKLNGDHIFTVSYNVKVSDEAVEQYLQSGYLHTGDANTDYKGNTTSSNQNGFRSNKVAYANFDLNGDTYTNYYPHPVVQVRTPEHEVLLNKLDSVNKSPLGGATFDIYRLVSDLSIPSVEIPGSGGLKGVKLEQTLVSGNDGKITIKGLIPGEYALVETKAPDGFNLLTDIIKFNVSIKGIVTSNDVAVQDNGLVVYNEVYYELPHTGGVGRTGLYIMGISLLMLTLAMIYIQHRRGGLFKKNHN